MMNATRKLFPTLELSWIDAQVDLSQVRMWDDLFWLIPGYVVMVKMLTILYSDENGRPNKSKSPILKPVMVIYNVFMTLFSLYICVNMVRWVSRNELYTEDCKKMKRDEEFYNLVYAFYLSKYAEYADTVFLILKGKNVSWLHWIHHLGAALDLGLLYASGLEASWIFLSLNGAIHTIMYFYYGCALMKIRLPGKSLITTMQIVQFLTGFALLFPYCYIDCVKTDPNQMFTWLYNYAYVGIILGLFINFYIQNYIVRAPKSKKAL